MPFSPHNKSKKKIVIACMIGNAMEYYDFVIYGYFAVILGRLFFPNSDPTTQLIATLGVFWVGFIARPLGGIIFGHIGDRFSRKTALALTIYLMAIPTTLMGCLPTYDQIGYMAPLLLVSLRFLQGLALGGEFTGSIVFLIEHANPKRQGFAGSFAPCSLIIGVIIGSLIAAAMMAWLDMEALESWGWRIPFLISCLGSIVGAFMLKSLSDPESYLKEKEKVKKEATFPLAELIKKHKIPIFLVIMIDFLNAVGFFILVIFCATYFEAFLHWPGTIALVVNTVSMLFFCGFILIGGLLADRYNRHAVLAYSSLFFIITGYPFFALFQIGPLYGLIAQSLMAMVMGLFFGALPVVLTKIFPASVRFSGLSLAHNISMAVFGGSAPLLATYLIRSTGNLNSPAWLLGGSAILTIIGLLLLSRKAFHLTPQSS
jgi:MFS transporter, MHS family, proline/betaine transporter